MSANLISANLTCGIEIASFGTSNNQVLQNSIGGVAVGQGALGNATFGIQIRDGASNNVINGAYIANNQEDGVNLILMATANTIINCGIFNNGGYGIADLGINNSYANNQISGNDLGDILHP